MTKKQIKSNDIGYKNVCIRCGKERIVAKTWEEETVLYGQTTTVTKSLFVCPDSVCQAKVDAGLQEQKRVSQERRDQAEAREVERRGKGRGK